MRDLARRLLAASRVENASEHNQELLVVSERLRISLTRFAGAEGFASLLRRALVQARADNPRLSSLKVGSSGQLEGIETLAGDPDVAAEAALAITTQLLTLLVTFIGETITHKLVHEAWPQTSLRQGDQKNTKKIESGT